MGIVTVGLQGAAARGRKVATLFCGNWGLTGRAGGILLAAADSVRLDEVVAAFAVLFATKGVDETERRGEDTSAHGEAGAVGLPVVVGIRVWGGFVEIGWLKIASGLLLVLKHIVL